MINQVPSIFGFSETKVDNSVGIDTDDDERATGRVALLSQEDFESDDIYIYYVDEGHNYRISTSSFGMPVGYRTNSSPFLGSVTAFLLLVVMEGMYFLARMPGVTRDWPSPAVTSNLLILVQPETFIFETSKPIPQMCPTQSSNCCIRSGVDPFAPNSSIPVIAG